MTEKAIVTPVQIDSKTKGTVQQILLSQDRGGSMVSVAAVQAFAGRGLFGDRNFGRPAKGGADKNVTLIESEKILEFARATGLEFNAEDARRNIVTSGIELNALLGQEFLVGTIRVKALELCEPCSLLAKRTHRAVLWGLVHKGGLRCRILTDGTIRCGDEIRLPTDE